MLRHSSTCRQFQSSISKKSRSSGVEEVVEPEVDSEEQGYERQQVPKVREAEKRREDYEDVSLLVASLAIGQDLSLV